MTTRYIHYPAGYPLTVYGVCQADDGWHVRSDTWHTPTSHTGWRADQTAFASRGEALAYLHERRRLGEFPEGAQIEE